jgi:hypothetical protein
MPTGVYLVANIGTWRIFMLVNWTKSGAKAIQLPQSKEMVVLSPGYNQVDDAKWGVCRNLVLCQIADEVIVEEWSEVERGSGDHKKAVFSTSCEGEKSKTTVRIPATFRDITRKRTDEVIKETFNVKTLQEWYDNDDRMDIRAKIYNQIEGVNKGSITG